ncbi:MAG: DUF4105 domain-containing protein [Flavobacteriales bacterium]
MIKNIFLSLLFIVSSLLGFAQNDPIDAQAEAAIREGRFSVLTCSPGPNLYSVFGHTAIRVEMVANGKIVDWVYNYGTFEFTEDFYVKFAKGQLDYRLSKADFGFFQQEYILTGRGIVEQELELDGNEKVKLFELLEKNYEPENRYYRYDFFYDNCATRVRDIINQSLNNEVQFSYVYPRQFTFRQSIQNYLDYMPWSDFGIDLALGMPCDRIVEKGQMMFLPDSLENDFSMAYVHDKPLTKRAVEILPKDFELNRVGWITPINVFGLFMIIQLMIGIWWGKISFVDRILLFTTGFIGLVVFLLWFFTDHGGTKWNLNILWANPINLYFAFSSFKKTWILKFFKVYGLIQAMIIIGWFFLPQRFHLATLPMIIGLLYISIRLVRPSFLPNRNENATKRKNTATA